MVHSKRIVTNFHTFRLNLVFFLKQFKIIFMFRFKNYSTWQIYFISFRMLFADKITRKGPLYCWCWINRVNMGDHNNKSGKCVIPFFFRFMLIASYFLYDIDNIVKRKKKTFKSFIDTILFLFLWLKVLFYYYEELCSMDLFIFNELSLQVNWWFMPLILFCNQKNG